MNETPKATSLGGRIKQKIILKGIPKKPQHVFFHVFAQATHVVAAPHGFACVGSIPATRLYIQSFIEIRSGVSEPQGVKIWLFLLLVVFTKACTTVQAVIDRANRKIDMAICFTPTPILVLGFSELSFRTKTSLTTALKL